MKTRDLLALIGAKLDNGNGRKRRIRTIDKRTKPFVATHQDLLRKYFSNPGAEVNISDLIDKKTNLALLGFESWPDANYRMVLAHPAGDDFAIRVLVGIVPESDIQAHQRRARREQHGLLQVMAGAQ